MVKLNTTDKEKLIIGTIIDCNKNIKSLFESNPKLKGNINTNIYHYNMVQLYEELGGTENESFINLNESYSPKPQHIGISNSRNNHLAYLNKVYDFLDGFEIGLQKNLNESLNIDGNDTDVKSDITTFKNDLKKIIKEMLAQNDLSNIPEEILKIKIFANKPLFVHGMDLMSNIALQKELVDKFKILNNDILSILFDKTNTQLLWVCLTQNNQPKIIYYDLKTDTLDLMKLPELKDFGPENYFIQLNEIINNNLVELYFNINKLEIKFTDNLFLDKQRNIINNQRNIVK